MKWFNADNYLVVVLEEGDTYGPDSSMVHRDREPRIRLFDLASKCSERDYPLLCDVGLTELGQLGSRGRNLPLVNGVELLATTVADLHEFTRSMLERVAEAQAPLLRFAA